MNAPATTSTATPTLELLPDEEICLVCNDTSTGYHYGTPSCNGCKTFFRRTVMKKQTFVCQYGGNCVISKNVRCACRHCRFAKCVAVGMNKDAIQQNRDPIGYTKRTRRYPQIKLINDISTTFDERMSTTSALKTMATSSLLSTPNMTNDGTMRNTTGTVQTDENRLLKELAWVEEQVQIVRNSQIFVQKSFWEIMLQPSIFYDLDLIAKQRQFPHNNDQLRHAKNSDHQYWHERDWMIMIEWAKIIPVYKILSFNDKMALLRHSAVSYPSLNQCFYTKVIDLDTIVFPDGSYFDRTQEPDRPVSLQRKKIKVFNNLLRPLRKLQLDMCEFAAAKAIFFLNPDADELSSEVRTSVNEARCAVTNALYRYMIGMNKHNESVNRFSKLLLLGTAISTIVVEAREAVVVANFFEQIQFFKLAKQLLNLKEDEIESAENRAQLSGGGSTRSVALTESDSLSEQSSLEASAARAETLPHFRLPTTTVADALTSAESSLASSKFAATFASSPQEASRTSVVNNFIPSAFTSYLTNSTVTSLLPQQIAYARTLGGDDVNTSSEYLSDAIGSSNVLLSEMAASGASLSLSHTMFDASSVGNASTIAIDRTKSAVAAAAMSSFLAAAASHPTIMRPAASHSD